MTEFKAGPDESLQILSGAEAKDSVVDEELAACRDEFLKALCTAEDGAFNEERYRRQEQSTLDAMAEHLKNERTTVIRINGKIAAIGSYQQVAERDGRPVYEICKELTLKEFRGRGLYSKLDDMLEAQIRAKDPTAFIFVRTSDPIVKARCLKKGWQQMGFRGEVEIMSITDISEDEILAIESRGADSFLFDPMS